MGCDHLTTRGWIDTKYFAMLRDDLWISGLDKRQSIDGEGKI
ncbi:MAG: hypothetical protein UY70_C0001G0040 [Candidatus Kaiserbacteria bacterium GW2011_GWB1_52_6]|uniref:Uncharacterized protein n=3 Tax=Candidatus Kaiseribacteriota TaxID=1752734 RepID=A0A0G1XIZ5_9BACT|nr:MAG: hypothetical protein UY67_C0007G0040 [Candidatus Kaiserbacteria bacterium GW2011_GWA2_52_12]KKW28204.1 MAG: hypothetical protein UY70_C0001G0040 [Candidatus Kaiserbacteria bacterium GW2011_GWB1_52_6]KKW31173.1 MAG: hypothetical protein UY74_C0022G0029 [Candidatus Kaiserbacteria bacterium GW2011_GWC2_52_8b]